MKLKITKSVSIKFKTGILKKAREYAERDKMSLDKYVEFALNRLMSSYTPIQVIVSKPKKVKQKITVVEISDESKEAH